MVLWYFIFIFFLPIFFMMRKLTVFALVLCILNSVAQEKGETSSLIFIYDASGSMWGQINGKTKMEIASGVLIGVVDNLPENQQVGLVAYGHRKEGDCEDVEFLVDIHNTDKTIVSESLQKIKPLGKTPLAHSAMLVVNKLRETKTNATIILITDGIESCGGNICEIIKTAREEGVDFRLHIVGFGLTQNETDELRCAAKAGDGNYYDAEDADGLTDVLNDATDETVKTLTDNFSVFAMKNDVPIDALVQAFESGTTNKSDAVRTYRDTGFMHLPAGKYDLKVTPLENSDVKPLTVAEVESFDDKIAHQTVSFDGGIIQVLTLNNGEGWDATVKVKSKDGKTISGGRTYGKAKQLEVNPGIYAVEVQAMVIEGTHKKHNFKNVKVQPGKTTKLEHNFKSGVVIIGAKNGQKLVDATVNIIEIGSNKNVAGGRTYASESSNPKKFVLSPGTYRAVLMAVSDFGGRRDTLAFTVQENQTIEKIADLNR